MEPTITLPIDEAVLKRAIRVWGTDAQSGMALEECLELCLEIRGMDRERTTREKLAEETADVLIAASQLRFILGSGLVDSYIHEKLNRLTGRMDDIESKNKDE